MDNSFIIGIVVTIIGYLSIKNLIANNNDKKIEKLENDKSKTEGKLEVVEAHRETLKEEVTKQQEHLSEEGKKKFWQDYLGKKND